MMPSPFNVPNNAACGCFGWRLFHGVDATFHPHTPKACLHYPTVCEWALLVTGLVSAYTTTTY